MSASAYDYTGYIQLQKSDIGYNSNTYNESSFTNMLDTTYGWNDPVNGKGAAPRSDADYVVSGGKTLCTPYDTEKFIGSSTRYKFNGRSLVIDNGGLDARTVWHASLEFDDLIFRGTSSLKNPGWAWDHTIYGKISLDADATVTIGSGGSGHDWYFENKFNAASSAVLICNGNATWPTTNKAAYVRFNGDCSEFFGTVRVSRKMTVYSNCTGGKFPGKVELSDISTFKIEASSAASLFEVGGITFGDTNCVLSIASGKSLTVGDLVFSGKGAKIEMMGGTLNVTNSLTVTQPVTIKIMTPAAPRTAVLSIPADHVEIPEDDFVMINSSGGSLDKKIYSLFWITEGNVRTLYLINATDSLYNATTGYMPLVVNENSVSLVPPYAFYEKGHWQDPDHVPGSVTTNYFIGSSYTMITPASRDPETNTFQGASLTLRGGIRLQQPNRLYTINDLRVLSVGSIHTSGNSGTYLLGGNMYVLAPEERPFTFRGGAKPHSYVCNMNIYGTDNAAIDSDASYTGSEREDNLHLLGDCTGYRGLVLVGTNVTLRLGNTGLSNGTVALYGDNAFLSSMATNSAVVSVGALRALVSSTVTVPETNSISAGSIDVTGTLTKNGEGVFAAGGTATAGDDAAISVAEGGLRADSAHAFDGIPITFADGATYVRDCGAADADLVQYGLYSASGVTAAGTLNVAFVNFTSTELEEEVALFTVPTSCANALRDAIHVSARPKGYAVDELFVVDDGSGKKTIKARFTRTGAMIIVF